MTVATNTKKTSEALMFGKKKLTPEDLDIPEPCEVELDPGTEGRSVHYCSHCEKSVYDTSKMTRSQIDELLDRPDVCMITVWEGDELQHEDDVSRVWGAAAGALAAGALVIGLGTFDLVEFAETGDAAIATSGGENASISMNVASSDPEPSAPVPTSGSASVEIPEDLSRAEQRLRYRLKTEFGVDVSDHGEHVDSYHPPRSVTLEDALDRLEETQRKRDDRMNGESSQIRKMTDADILESRPRRRVTRGKVVPKAVPEIKIIRRD